MLASLNHPNIATLHGLEEVGDATLLEMELVPGETLAERIERGPMAADDTLPIFKQIAQALEAAHERGIIHRDLKPSNVKVTPEGRVKVLDFGLAKAFESERPESSSNAALFTTTTQRGLILGTAAYMSPEHVRGKPLDRRTDIWAFGCMFYEALTGKRAVRGRDDLRHAGRGPREEPDWRGLSHAPLAVQRLIRRCLGRIRRPGCTTSPMPGSRSRTRSTKARRWSCRFPATSRPHLEEARGRGGCGRR